MLSFVIIQFYIDTIILCGPTKLVLHLDKNVHTLTEANIYHVRSNSKYSQYYERYKKSGHFVPKS
jgi:hypothetical protein